MIEVVGARKNYGPVEALKGIDLSIDRGQIVGILGPNGAGKTTLIKAMLGLVRLDHGAIGIAGLRSGNSQCRNGLSYLPEKFSFYAYYQVEDVLDFYSRSHGGGGRKIEEALEKVGIGELKKRKIHQLSKGQLQRVGIATMLVTDVDLYIVDEPFSGLDPIGIKEIKDIFVELKRLGKTLVINSHILSEIEKFCDRVAILHEGNLLDFLKVSSILEKGTLEDYFYQKIKGPVGR